MSSVAQVEANRRNCLLSTGPVTPEGKSVCGANALKHGLRSRSVLAPGESPQEYEEFVRALWADLAPQGAAEEVLAQRAAEQSWRLRRAAVWEAAILAEAACGGFENAAGSASEAEAGGMQDAAGGRVYGERLELALRRLDVLRRYERTIEQGFHQALRELRAAQKARREEERARLREADEALERRRRAARTEAAESHRRANSMVEDFIAQDQAWAAGIEEEFRQRGPASTASPRPRQTEPIEEEDADAEEERREDAGRGDTQREPGKQDLGGAMRI